MRNPVGADAKSPYHVFQGVRITDTREQGSFTVARTEPFARQKSFQPSLCALDSSRITDTPPPPPYMLNFPEMVHHAAGNVCY